MHRLHHARLSRQIHALHESAAGFASLLGGGADIWPRNSCVAAVYAVVAEQRAKLAQADAVMWGGHSCPQRLNLFLNFEFVFGTLNLFLNSCGGAGFRDD